MRDGWRALALGDLLKRVRRTVRVEEGRQYAAVSVTKDGAGLGPKEPFIGGISNYSTLFRISTGDVVVRTITAFESPVAVAHENHDGSHVSQVFLTYEVSSDADPRFLELFFQTEPFWNEMRNRATGTVLRRKTISHEAFCNIPILLPPLDVQRRIVDMVSAIDAYQAQLASEMQRTVRLLEASALRRLSLPGDAGEGVPLSDLLCVNIGGVWGMEPGAGGLATCVYRTTEFSDLGYLAGPAQALRGIQPNQLQSRGLRSGDVLVEKSGGTPARPVGRVVRVAEGDLTTRATGANFLQILRPDPKRVDPGYLFWILWASHRRGDSLEFQQASTNIRNLKVQAYLGRRVVLPTWTTQQVVAAALDALLVGIRCLEQEQQALRRVRQSILGALLEGKTDIPDSYDALLGEVA